MSGVSGASGGTKWKCQYCLIEIPGVVLVPKFCFQCGKEQTEATTPLTCGNPECSNQVSSLGNKCCDPCSMKNAETVKAPIQESTTESLPKDVLVEEEEDAIKKAKHIQQDITSSDIGGEGESKVKPIVVEKEKSIINPRTNNASNVSSTAQSMDQDSAHDINKNVSHEPDSQCSYVIQVFGMPVVGIHQDQTKIFDPSQVSSLCKSDSDRESITRSQEGHPASADQPRSLRMRSGSDSMPSSAIKKPSNTDHPFHSPQLHRKNVQQENQHTSQETSSIIDGRQASSGSSGHANGGSGDQANGKSGSGGQTNDGNGSGQVNGGSGGQTNGGSGKSESGGQANRHDDPGEDGKVREIILKGERVVTS